MAGSIITGFNLREHDVGFLEEPRGGFTTGLQLEKLEIVNPIIKRLQSASFG